MHVFDCQFGIIECNKASQYATINAFTEYWCERIKWFVFFISTFISPPPCTFTFCSHSLPFNHFPPPPKLIPILAGSVSFTLPRRSTLAARFQCNYYSFYRVFTSCSSLLWFVCIFTTIFFHFIFANIHFQMFTVHFTISGIYVTQERTKRFCCCWSFVRFQFFLCCTWFYKHFLCDCVCAPDFSRPKSKQICEEMEIIVVACVLTCFEHCLIGNSSVHFAAIEIA